MIPGTRSFFMHYLLRFAAVVLGACFLAATHPGEPATGRLSYKMPAETVLNYSYQVTAATDEAGSGAKQTETEATVRLIAQGVDSTGNLCVELSNRSFSVRVSSARVDTVFTEPAGVTGRRVLKCLRPNGDQVSSTEIDAFEVLPFAPGFTSALEFLTNLPTQALLPGQPATLIDVDSTQVYGGLTVSRSTVSFSLQGEEVRLGYSCVRLNFDGTSTLNVDGKVAGSDFLLQGDGVISGTLWFAPYKGILVESQTETRLELTATLSGRETTPFPITQVSRVAIVLAE